MGEPVSEHDIVPAGPDATHADELETGSEISPEAAAELAATEKAAEALGVRLLVLDQRVARARREYNQASAEAWPVFAKLRNAKIPQVAPELGQGRAALISLIAGPKTIKVDEDELLLLYAAGSPSDLEEYVVPAAWTDGRVVKLIAEHFPDYVEMRINATVRADVDKQIEKRDGWVADPATGDLVKIAEVTRHPANGQFQLRPDPRAGLMITAAIEAGRITEDGTTITPGSEESK